MSLLVKSLALLVESLTLLVEFLSLAVQSLVLRSHYFAILVPATAHIQFLAAATSANHYNLILATSHTMAKGMAYYTGQGEIE